MVSVTWASMAKDTTTRHKILQCEGPFSGIFRYSCNFPYFSNSGNKPIVSVDAEWGLGKKEGRFRVVGIG